MQRRNAYFSTSLIRLFKSICIAINQGQCQESSCRVQSINFKPDIPKRIR